MSLEMEAGMNTKDYDALLTGLLQRQQELEKHARHHDSVDEFFRKAEHLVLESVALASLVFAGIHITITEAKGVDSGHSSVTSGQADPKQMQKLMELNQRAVSDAIGFDNFTRLNNLLKDSSNLGPPEPPPSTHVSPFGYRPRRSPSSSSSIHLPKDVPPLLVPITPPVVVSQPPSYYRGDFVKVELREDRATESESVWLKVDHTDEAARLVYGRLAKGSHVVDMSVKFENIIEHIKCSLWPDDTSHSALP